MYRKISVCHQLHEYDWGNSRINHVFSPFYVYVLVYGYCFKLHIYCDGMYCVCNTQGLGLFLQKLYKDAWSLEGSSPFHSPLILKLPQLNCYLGSDSSQFKITKWFSNGGHEITASLS